MMKDDHVGGINKRVTEILRQKMSREPLTARNDVLRREALNHRGELIELLGHRKCKAKLLGDVDEALLDLGE